MVRILALITVLGLLETSSGFTTPVNTRKPFGNGGVRPFSQSTMFAELPEIQSMKPGEIRSELESYGISTKSFLEKKELIEALEKARAEGKEPVDNNNKKEEPKKESSKTQGSSQASREERIKEQMEKAQAMKVGELKKELEGMGVSTKSFFEKPEFVKAYAEAVVDGVKNKGGTKSRSQEDDYDSSYRDVVMQKFDARSQQLLLRGTLIDIKV